MGHLDLHDETAYRQWVNDKRAAYEKRKSADFPLIIKIQSNGDIPQKELQLIDQQIQDFNFALYKLDGEVGDHLAALKNIGSQMGLQELDKNLCAREDRVTKLTVQETGRANHYIPYSNKAIGWHTDGYYNPFNQRVQAMVLHCEQPAEQGGENQLVDQDMAYIHLRNQDVRYVEALSRPQVMCIPENVEDGVLVRPQTCSAVFVQEQDHALAMRYSKRKHNIIWADDALTQEALACLVEFLESDSPYHVRYRLNAGEGVINNNVLHTRSSFTDSADSKRVFYRARYYNRINIH